ncbi:cell division protein FtsA [Rossellomorea marisflavi]
MVKKNQKIFALDIGTRSVVGIIMEEMDDHFQVSDILIEEHRERAMLDGQIHDVPAVAAVITSIKSRLEDAHGPLRKVCVAAAGRALRTETASITSSIKGKPLLKKDDVLHLEFGAVQEAQAKAAGDDAGHHYYCVGYSVLYYRLDGEEIGSLIDQQGDEASVEIIATFLPRVVVDSLFAALQRAGLELEALTLEPIAAINVLIPQSMRRLNVALVDVGAGTSDVALTNHGTVTAYGMVPTAGDEITEALSRELLLDFPLAEKAKRQLHDSPSIEVTDILGFETVIPSDEVLRRIGASIERLAKEISDEILRLNNMKAPQAVMLVGGGSLTPGLPTKLASVLGLPENRAAVRGVEAIQRVKLQGHMLKGPELVTPIGIAIAARETPVQYVTVDVNGHAVRMFEVKNLTVGDCILSAGVKVQDLHGKPGKAISVTVNGQTLSLPGSPGEPPSLYKNDQACSFDDGVGNQDRLLVEKGRDGDEPVVTIGELMDEGSGKQVYLQERELLLEPGIMLNGVPSGKETVLKDGDIVDITFIETIADALSQLGYHDWISSLRPFHLSLNGKETYFPAFNGKLLRNGQEVRPTAMVHHLDRLTFEAPSQPTLGLLLNKKKMLLTKSITISFNGEDVTLEKVFTTVKRNGDELSGEDLVFSGDELMILESADSPFIFQDVFNFVEIDMPTNTRGSFLLLRNKLETTFFDEIRDGDLLEIVWPEIKVR